VEKALEAKKEFGAAGYEFSAGMLAMLFDLMIRVGNLGEAETSLTELKKVAPDFVLDEHKIIDFATLLVSEGHIDGKYVIYLHGTGSSLNR
jgi:leucine-rich PPR motif-containing protein